MAIQKADLTAVTGDTVFTGFDKYNNTCDEIVTSATSSNGVITFTKFGGGTFPVNVPLSKNEIINGGLLTINPLDFLEVEVAEVTYNLDGQSYSIAVPTTVTISAGDPTNPRIDLIYALDDLTIGVTAGTPSANPVVPLPAVGQTIIGYVYVDANANSAGGTSLPIFQQNSSGTPNNTVRFDSNGNLTETDVITTNGTDITIKSGAIINIDSNTITGDNLTIESNVNLDIFSDTFINMGVQVGFDINQVTVDVNSVNITASAGTSDININAGGDLNITSTDTVFNTNSISMDNGYINFGTLNTLTVVRGGAIGANNTVSGFYGLAFGDGNNITGNASYAFGEDNIISATSSMTIGKQNDISGRWSFISGEDNVNTEDWCFNMGASTKTEGFNSFAGGKGDFSTNRYVLASGQTSFNFSENSVAQTAGHGALSISSVILGGLDHNIEVGADYSMILGGNLTKLSATAINTIAIGLDTQTVTVPNRTVVTGLNIMQVADMYTATLNTTNATPTVIDSIPISINTVKRIEVELLAYNSTTFTSYEVAKYFGCGFRAGGNVAVSALSSTIIENFAPNITLTFVANTTTQAIDITATGIAGTNISWKLKISII